MPALPKGEFPRTSRGGRRSEENRRPPSFPKKGRRHSFASGEPLPQSSRQKTEKGSPGGPEPFGARRKRKERSLTKARSAGNNDGSTGPMAGKGQNGKRFLMSKNNPVISEIGGGKNVIVSPALLRRKNIRRGKKKGRRPGTVRGQSGSRRGKRRRRSSEGRVAASEKES